MLFSDDSHMTHHFWERVSICSHDRSTQVASAIAKLLLVKACRAYTMLAIMAVAAGHWTSPITAKCPLHHGEATSHF
jgi:hypothetical protein